MHAWRLANYCIPLTSTRLERILHRKESKRARSVESRFWNFVQLIIYCDAWYYCFGFWCEQCSSRELWLVQQDLTDCTQVRLQIFMRLHYIYYFAFFLLSQHREDQIIVIIREYVRFLWPIAPPMPKFSRQFWWNAKNLGRCFFFFPTPQKRYLYFFRKTQVIIFSRCLVVWVIAKWSSFTGCCPATKEEACHRMLGLWVMRIRYERNATRWNCQRLSFLGILWHPSACRGCRKDANVAEYTCRECIWY